MINTVLAALKGLVAAAACAGACAQDTRSLDGNWTARFHIANGTARTATVAISGDAGIWQTQARNPNDPCVGQKIPFVVDEVPDGIKLNLFGSKALAGCNDGTLAFQRQPDGSYAGQFSDGRAVKLVR